MATDNTQLQPPSSESREAGYEASTVSVKALMIFFICLVIVGGLIHLGAGFLLKSLVTHDQGHDGSSSAFTESRPPPPPRLQPTPGQQAQNVPAADLADMYEKENAVFGRMGWTTDKHNPAELGIPQSVISQVIQDESAKQQSDGRP